jgi:putative lipoic acid-binding regulatory protein
MAQDESPHIEFPCRYPIKVIGLDVDDFSNEVIRIIRKHAPDPEDKDISFRPSSEGKYLAVNVIIVATGAQQIEKIFNDLKASGRTSMVL